MLANSVISRSPHNLAFDPCLLNHKADDLVLRFLSRYEEISLDANGLYK